MKSLIISAIWMLISLTAFAERINKSEIVSHPDQEKRYNENYWSKEIKISKDITLKPELEITYRGNGFLKIANLDLYIYRWGYNTAIIYKNCMLNVDFVDINGDGFKDIVISGLALYPHEQREIILKREPVLFIYLFDPKKKKFNLDYINSSFYLEVGSKDNRELYGEQYIVEKYVNEGRKEAEKENRKKYNGVTRECARVEYRELDKCYDEMLQIGPGIKQQAYMKIPQGYRDDGWLKIANLNLNVCGENLGIGHENADRLDVDFIDINGDGFKDIVVSGILSYMFDAHNDIILPSEPVVFIYLFDPKKKEFYCAYRNASFKLEESASQYVKSRVEEANAAIEKFNKSLEKKRLELAIPEETN